jgi:protein ImuB
MAITYARSLIADLDIEEADPTGDAYWLERLGLYAAQRWSPIAMVDGTDGLLVDLTGASHLFGGEEAMAIRIGRFCRRLGLNARIAIAGSIGAAHALARHAPKILTIVSPYGDLDALAPLPLTALRLDPRQIETARRLGIESIADIVAMPRAPVAKRFGASLLQRLDQAIGRLPEPFDALVPYEVPKAIMRFAEPIGSAEPIAMAMAELTHNLIGTLLGRGLGARAIRLVCKRVDHVDQVISIGMARATRNAGHILRLLGMKIETIDPGFGIDAMQLIATRAEPLGPEALARILDPAGAAADIETLIDQIVTRLGEAAIFRSSAVESHVPERSVRRIAPMHQPLPWPTLWPRPARLLARPEPLSGVIALLPDQPPRRFIWRGDTHIVTCADGPERITGEWWKRVGEAYAVRDYFRLENERGERFWVFRRGDGQDPQTGDLSWHMHGVFG